MEFDQIEQSHHWQPEKLSPEVIQKRLGRLMRRYLRTRSPAVASLVARHIETLFSHPDFAPDPGECCVYMRLKTHWRWLANTNPSAPGA